LASDKLVQIPFKAVKETNWFSNFVHNTKFQSKFQWVVATWYKKTIIEANTYSC
jgi:hypothetical protein